MPKPEQLGEVEDFNYLYSMKECTKCHETKELTEFHKHPLGKYGVNSICKKCHSKRNAEYNSGKGKENHIKALKRYLNTDKGKKMRNKYHSKLGSGVYGIFENSIALYVGETTTLKRRQIQHNTCIKNPEINKRHKQLYYNLQQHSNLEFKILEETPNHKEREQYWINKLKPKYNGKDV